jgi:Fe-Mn family superoxide dismutase
LLNLTKAPLQVHASIRQNAGEHVNHSLFWRATSHAGQGSPAPVGALAKALDRDFGGLEQFRQIQDLLPIVMPLYVAAR